MGLIYNLFCESKNTLSLIFLDIGDFFGPLNFCDKYPVKGSCLIHRIDAPPRKGTFIPQKVAIVDVIHP